MCKGCKCGGACKKDNIATAGTMDASQIKVKEISYDYNGNISADAVLYKGEVLFNPNNAEHMNLLTGTLTDSVSYKAKNYKLDLQDEDAMMYLADWIRSQFPEGTKEVELVISFKTNHKE